MKLPKGEEIDIGILPLIDAMNSTGWIKTVSCCEGHPGSKYNETPYVAFFCKSSKLSELAKIMNQITREADVFFNDLSWVFHDEVYGNQYDAPKGWISLDLQLTNCGETPTEEAKKRIFDIATESFKYMTKKQMLP